MTVRTLLPALAGVLLLSSTALGGTVPKVDLCHALSEDLRLDLLLIDDYHPAHDQATAALDEGSAKCGTGDSAAGVEILTAGISSLGLPVRTHGD
jgi:hypothetical protein